MYTVKLIRVRKRHISSMKGKKNESKYTVVSYIHLYTHSSTHHVNFFLGDILEDIWTFYWANRTGY